ncbi:hypothetical protein CLOP_g5020 [Closterium sp. NIES-67]|nr:hypothetical protein CLOP_g5020 [Closterium sp. NIES-67]
MTSGLKPDVNVSSRTSTFQAGRQRFKPDVNVSSRTSTFQAGSQRSSRKSTFKPEVNVSSRKSTFQAGRQRFKPDSTFEGRQAARQGSSASTSSVATRIAMQPTSEPANQPTGQPGDPVDPGRWWQHAVTHWRAAGDRQQPLLSCCQLCQDMAQQPGTWGGMGGGAREGREHCSGQQRESMGWRVWHTSSLGDIWKQQQHQTQPQQQKQQQGGLGSLV